MLRVHQRGRVERRGCRISSLCSVVKLEYRVCERNRSLLCWCGVANLGSGQQGLVVEHRTVGTERKVQNVQDRSVIRTRTGDLTCSGQVYGSRAGTVEANLLRDSRRRRRVECRRAARRRVLTTNGVRVPSQHASVRHAHYRIGVNALYGIRRNRRLLSLNGCSRKSKGQDGPPRVLSWFTCVC